MKQRIFSFVFLVTSIVIGLGAFGHAEQWWKVVYPVLGNRLSDPRMLNMLLAVWLFVSGGMLSFGLVLIWTWLRMRKGDRGVAVIPIGIASSSSACCRGLTLADFSRCSWYLAFHCSFPPSL
jgi:hypothetical protein